MVIRKATYFLISIFIYMLFIQADCKKMTGCAETVYNFEIGVTGYPDKDSIYVGDTLWLEINTPDTLRDIATNELINYGGVENLGALIAFSKLINEVYNGKALLKFTLLLKKGQKLMNNVDPESFNEYRFNDENGFYQFKLGVIPSDTGTFRISFSNAANVYRRSDKCTKASFEINFIQTDQHYYYFPGYQGDPFQKSGTYYFKVMP